MSSVNKVINDLEVLTARIEQLQELVTEGFRRIEAQGFKLEPTECEEQVTKVIEMHGEPEGHLVKQTTLTEVEWLDNATFLSYAVNLEKFENNTDVFKQVILARNAGWSMKQIVDQNPRVVPTQNISFIYNCINAARRKGYVGIHSGKYHFTNAFYTIKASRGASC